MTVWDRGGLNRSSSSQNLFASSPCKDTTSGTMMAPRAGSSEAGSPTSERKKTRSILSLSVRDQPLRLYGIERRQIRLRIGVRLGGQAVGVITVLLEPAQRLQRFQRYRKIAIIRFELIDQPCAFTEPMVIEQLE